jgi:twitching motility protein PilT
MELSEILSEAVRNDASDILLKVGVPPAFRLGSDLMPLEGAPVMDQTALDRVMDVLLDDKRRVRFETEWQVDLAYEHPDLGRFRINAFRQRGLTSLVIRVIKTHIRNVEELNLPTVVERISNERRGLVLVTGTTGSGKSTTLAAMIDHINRSRQAHIITIEDPIEYVHRDGMSFINQREVGYDTVNFSTALKAALRQNPDVILVGEMRDRETIETAIMAAETGHLVMSTLHTLDAPETITRTISAFPEDQRDQVRLILSSVLKGIISQRLIPRADKQGMVPAVEVLVSTARVREYVADKEKCRELHDVISQGHTTYGMQTFDQSLMALFRSGLITYDEALLHCTNVTDFELKVRGIASTSDSKWTDFEDDDTPGESDDRSAKLDIERF